MLIERSIKDSIIHRLETSQKAIVIYGARQVGKTTLSKDIINKVPHRGLYINTDEEKYLDILSSRDSQKMKDLISSYELILIDEAQRIENIGINLKIMIDTFSDLKIIATGSSSFDLANKINEPLTGRIWSYILYPISLLELKKYYNPFEMKSQLEERLIFGSYPEIINLQSKDDKKKYLESISTSYLYKDILQLTDIKHSSKIKDLLKLLSFQIGSEVSLSELGISLGLAKETVANYIDLLEKSFIIFRLGGFSRNLRKEVSKMDKIYFYDLGIRNILIDNLKPLKDRDDLGQLWENFLISERIKLLAYKQEPANKYFWRLHTGAEIDYVEERGGKIWGYELKIGDKIASSPLSWKQTYPNAEFATINQENYLKFICGSVNNLNENSNS